MGRLQNIGSVKRKVFACKEDANNWKRNKQQKLLHTLNELRYTIETKETEKEKTQANNNYYYLRYCWRFRSKNYKKLELQPVSKKRTGNPKIEMETSCTIKEKGSRIYITNWKSYGKEGNKRKSTLRRELSPEVFW